LVLIRMDENPEGIVPGARWRAAAANGFHGIEWAAPWPVATDAPPPAPDDAIVKAVALACPTVEIEAALTWMAGVLRWCRTYGASYVSVALPPIHPHAARESFGRYQEGLNFAYQFLRRIRFDAEAAGVSVALETAHGGCLLSPVEVRELIDAANSWAVGACVDFERIARIGEPRDWLTTLRHRALAVRMPPGIGAAIDRTSEPGAETLNRLLSPTRALLDEVRSPAAIVCPGSLAGEVGVG
jgi:sugar phosphate isomerase/epimerase